MISFTVNAVPVAQPRQRHRVVGKVAMNYTPTKHPVTAFKATVRCACPADVAPLDGPLSLSITFVMPRPKAMVWKTKPMPRECHAKKPDADNLAKAVKDALTGLLWRDDSQIARLCVEKWIASGDEQPHCRIEVEPRIAEAGS